jgi:hypothetical protein
VGHVLHAAARLPWWAALVLAFIAFVMVHPFAIMEVAPHARGDDFGMLTSKEFWRGLAGTMQYVAPAVLVVAPLIAALIECAIRGRDA